MRAVIRVQIIVAIPAALVAGLAGSWSITVPVLYGALVGLLVTWLTGRGVDRTLNTAVRDSGRAMVAMYAGFALKYMLAALGLLIGLRLLQFEALPMIGTFIMMVVVQATAAIWLRPHAE